MRWTRQRFARDGIAGRVERLVSDQQRADERCCSVRRSRVVLTPRRWRQVCGVKSAQPGLRQNISVGDGGKRARSPRRARRKPLNHCVRERRVIPGYSLLLVCVLPIPSAHEAAGATGIRRSPRPLWAEDLSTPRAHCAARSRSRVCSSTSLRAQRSNPFFTRQDGLLRFARNDVIMRLPRHTLRPSSPAKAGDPVFRGVSDGDEKLRHTGYSAFAEYDGLGEATRHAPAPLSTSRAESASHLPASRPPPSHASRLTAPPIPRGG